MPIIPPKDDRKPITLNVRLPPSLVDELTRIATETGHSRHEVMLLLLQHGVKEYGSEKRTRR